MLNIRIVKHVHELYLCSCFVSILVWFLFYDDVYFRSFIYWCYWILISYIWFSDALILFIPIWIHVMLHNFHLLKDKANLPLYLKGRSAWIFSNDSLEKVRKSYNLGLLSSHELMHDVSMFIEGVPLLRWCYRCVKRSET